jgi:elongation factor Ts
MTTPTIGAAAVKELRERTGAGMMDCKHALEETGGDLEKAVALLRERNQASAARKAGREAREGLVYSYIHTGGRIGALVEVNCETDFVAKTNEFQEFTRDVAMQIAAMSPRWLTTEEVPPEVLAKEREIRVEQNKQSGKPPNVIDKIVEGQVKKWYTEVCLLDQPFIRENKKDIRLLLTELVAKVGENCRVRRFVRWEVGEGIEVQKKDLAEELKELVK